MSFPANQLQHLHDMQALCDEIIDQTKALDATRKLIRALNRNLRNLQDFYEQHWLALAQDKRLSESDVRALESAIAKGRYSILDQDTIWNALQDAHHTQMAVLKVLVKDLRG